MSKLVSLLYAATTTAAVAQNAMVSTQSVYTGMCDASAAVALTGEYFAVANDEDNAIRVYNARVAGQPLKSYELARFLRVDRKNPETDIEGACRVGDRIYWITSHGQNQEGKYRASRHFLFATAISGGGELSLEGQPYRTLLADMLREPRLRPYGLASGSVLPPKSRGGVNIEGLCATPQGQLLIGFRNPIPQGRALIVPMLNPDEVMAGRTPRFGNPILLNLDGLGIRDIAMRGDEFLIVAGAYDGSGGTRLYRWAGGQGQPEPVRGMDLGDLTAEALVIYPNDNSRLQVLSDDGTRRIGGTPCKKLANPLLRQFRGVWVNFAATPNVKSN